MDCARRRADVIIVGGGIIGISTALNLKLQGVDRVAVLERHHIGAGQSGRAAGVVRALVRDPMVSGWLLEAIQFFSNFTAEYGESLDVHEAGFLLLSRPREEAQVEAAIAALEQAGGAANRIDVRQTQILQPGLRADGETRYAFEPGAIYVDPMVATQALAALARRLGVEICEGCEVGQIQLRGDAVSGVESSAGCWQSPVVLVATSVWGRAQLARVGVNVPVYPHRAEMAFFRAPLAGEYRFQRILSDTRSMLYMRPEGEAQLFVGWREGDRIGGKADLVAEDPDNYKQTAHYQTVQDMQARLQVTLPFMAEGFVHRTYACVYDYTADALPIMDIAPAVSGLYFVLGFSGGGFSLSPWIGRMMAQWIAAGAAARPAACKALRLARFAEGELIDYLRMDSQ